METIKHRRRDLPILLTWCLLLMLAWGIWLYQLDASDLTFDEAATYFVAYRPLLDILKYLQGAVREHPPVYYLLIRGWMALVGTSEFSLRVFSLGAGLVALTLTGWLARLAADLVHPHPSPNSRAILGLVPAALLIFTPGMAYYARDARMYSLSVAWALLSAGLFLRDWLTPSTHTWPRRAAIASLITVHSLMLFTHYYLLLPILVQPLLLLLTRRFRSLLTWCAIHLLPALAGLAWLWLSPGLQLTTQGLGSSLTLTLPAGSQLTYLFGKIMCSPVIGLQHNLTHWLLILIGGGILLTTWRKWELGLWLTLALTLPLILAHLLPQPPTPRYLIYIIPFAILALSALCAAPLLLPRRRWLGRGATLLLTLTLIRALSGGGLAQAITHDRSHYGQTLETIQALARPGDSLIFYGPWQMIQFHYYDPGHLPPITPLPHHAPPHLDPAEAKAVLTERLAQSERLWIVYAAVDDVDPAHHAEGWLRAHAHAVWRTADWSLYLPPLPAEAPVVQTDLTFGPSLVLEQVTREPGPIPAGEPLRLTLHWIPLRSLERDVRLALSLIDGTGHVWETVYAVPNAWIAPPSTWTPNQPVTDREGLTIPQGAPPGDYTLRLMVTDGESGEPLLLNNDETDGEKAADLLTVQVAEPVRSPVLIERLSPTNPVTFCAPNRTDCLTLSGHEPGGLRFQQGYPVPLTLHWLSPSRPLPELTLDLRIVPRSRLPWLPPRQPPIVTHTLPLAPTYPTTAWPPDRLVTLPTALLLPADAPTGPAQVTLRVSEPGGPPWTTPEGDTALPLFDLTVEGRPVLRRLPAGLTPVQVDLGAEVGLRGYRVEGTPQPGGQLRLTYAWYARTHPTAIYAVFNHLLTAADGSPVAQADGWPQEGRMLSLQWQPGEFIEDHYTLNIPADAPPPPYVLFTGLYNAATGDRIPALQDGQRLPDDQLPIPLPGESANRP